MRPAHRMTTASKEPASSLVISSALAFTTRVFDRANSRTAVERNEARLLLDSIIVSRRSGITILSGIPGTPTPDPRSSNVTTGCGRISRKRRLSRRSSSTSHRGLVDPTSRWALCHLVIKSRYLQNISVSWPVKGLARIDGAPETRASTAGVICQGRRPRRRDPIPSRLHRGPGGRSHDAASH